MSYDRVLGLLNERDEKQNRLKLLVVEDNHEVVEGWKDTFLESYFDVKYISSWQGLQKHLITSESFLPDLILSDVDFSDDKHIASADYGKLSMGTAPIGLMLILPFIQNSHYCQLSIYSSKVFSYTPEQILQQSELRSPWIILPLGIIAAAQNKPTKPYSSSILTMEEDISTIENTEILKNGSVEELILNSYSDMLSPQQALESCVKKYRQGLFDKSANGDITFDKKLYSNLLIKLKNLLEEIKSNSKVDLSMDKEFYLAYRAETLPTKESLVCLWSLFGDKIKPLGHQYDVNMKNVVSSIIEELESIELCNDDILDKVCLVIEQAQKDLDNYWVLNTETGTDRALIKYVDRVLQTGITEEERLEIKRIFIMFECVRLHLAAQTLSLKSFKGIQSRIIGGDRKILERIVFQTGGPFGYDDCMPEIHYDYTKHQISFEENTRLTNLAKWFLESNNALCTKGLKSKPLQFNLDEFSSVISQMTIKA